MSVVLIIDHNENIYDSVKQSRSLEKQSTRFVSKFNESIKQEIVTRPRKAHATMGLPHRPPAEPSDYLKKNEGIHFKLLAKPGPKPESHVPPVPKTADLLEQDRNKTKRPEKNFISENVKNVLKMKPKEPEQKIVIDQFGMSKKASTMEPKYILTATFGKTPVYLKRFIKMKMQNLQFKRDTTGLEQPKCKYITKDERDTLLRGLKENWEELQQNYQGLPILTDTIPKMQRKSKLEADLKQLEKDIVILERHPYIYVYNDNEQN